MNRLFILTILLLLTIEFGVSENIRAAVFSIETSSGYDSNVSLSDEYQNASFWGIKLNGSDIKAAIPDFSDSKTPDDPPHFIQGGWEVNANVFGAADYYSDYDTGVYMGWGDINLSCQSEKYLFEVKGTSGFERDDLFSESSYDSVGAGIGITYFTERNLSIFLMQTVDYRSYLEPSYRSVEPWDPPPPNAPDFFIRKEARNIMFYKTELDFFTAKNKSLSYGISTLIEFENSDADLHNTHSAKLSLYSTYKPSILWSFSASVSSRFLEYTKGQYRDDTELESGATLSITTWFKEQELFLNFEHTNLYDMEAESVDNQSIIRLGFIHYF